MKLFDKKSLILLISVVSINLLCIISVSYAYFTANIVGNDKAEEMTVTAGTMKITYTDSNIVTLNNAIPGDTLTKQFKVENTGNLDTKYNIKIKVDANDFKDKKDLVYTLTKNGEQQPEKVLPYEDGYIVIENEIKEKGIDNYTLTLNFKKDESNQNDNANKKVKFKIEVDSETDVKLYEYEEPLKNNFYNTMITSEDTLYDDYGNLRYVGAEPNNYIWFNCDNYEEPTEDTCEKWRIIGLFKDIQKPGGTSEDLVKIIRADSIGSIAWDSAGKNNWYNASLQKGLNVPYLNNEDSTWITTDEYIGSSSRPNTANPSYKSISPLTLNMIEEVTWNIGGSSEYNGVLTSQWYEYERGSGTYNSQPSIWNGYIGLMYPSDYGYATGGGSTTDRNACLAKSLTTNWKEAPYNTECVENDWLQSKDYPWSLTPNAYFPGLVFGVDIYGPVYHDNTMYSRPVRPSLYLTSNVRIIDGKGTNEEPYILTA